MVLTLLLAAGGFGAGAFGALLGLGGGVLVVPLLALGFGLPFREAVAISLLAVVATSSASAAVYLRRGLANLRLGLVLESATVIGAILGGLVAFALDERLLAGFFAVMLVYVAISMARRRDVRPTAGAAGAEPPPAADEGGAPSLIDPATEDASVGPPPQTSRSLRDSLAGPDYSVHRLPLGLALSGGAGIVSALLGVGGGIVKVPTMHLAMGLPLRASTATSNLTMGITASASAILYVMRDSVDPTVAAPVLVGTFLGATLTARFSSRVPVAVLRWIFVIVLLYVALQMVLRAVTPMVGT